MHVVHNNTLGDNNAEDSPCIPVTLQQSTSRARTQAEHYILITLSDGLVLVFTRIHCNQKYYLLSEQISI